MTPMPSKSDPPGAAGEAEKQAAAAAAASVSSGFPQTPDVTEPSSSSLNQTSKAETVQVPVTTSAPSSSTSDLLPAIREPVQDEVIIPVSTNQSEPANWPENQPSSQPVTTAGSIDIAQDEYLTTKTWLPDSALPAEHRQQHATIKGPEPVKNVATNSSILVSKEVVTAPSSTITPVLLVSNSTTRVKTSSESADEIRIAEPAADSLVPESPPVTTVENNLVT